MLKSIDDTIFADDQSLVYKLVEWRASGDKIVMTSGVFDILHRGHYSVLNQARGLGDRLIVAINTDESVKSKKGPLRPINSLKDRLFALANLWSVDGVISFEDSSNQPETLIRVIKPDIFVKSSGEWTDESLVCKEFIESYGGRAVVVRHTSGYSTTNLIKRIVASYGN